MADAPVLGAGSYGVWVQVPSPAPVSKEVDCCKAIGFFWFLLDK